MDVLPTVHGAGSNPRCRYLLLLALLLIGLSGYSAAQISTTTTTTATPQSGTWKLVWRDEFNGANGAPPDASKWTAEIGGSGWGNNELQYYTARAENVQQSEGKLVITARRENYSQPNAPSRSYTSARLKTAGKFSQKYGRFEARIKLPETQGMWPAFWLLGEDKGQVGWPECGEIDIMELVGSAPSTVLGTIHGPGYSGGDGISRNYTLADGKRFSEAFHTFAVEWEPSVIRFYVDDVLYTTRTPADLPSGTRWVYDHPFFIILNLAVGGGLPGNPDETTVFPQEMLVDYVRVYAR